MSIDQVVGHLKRRRIDLGKTIAEVADAIGISRPGLSKHEAGESKPSNETLAKWAAALGVRVVWDSQHGWRIEQG